MRFVSEHSGYADQISEPKSLEVIYFETDAPYFVIVLAAKTSDVWYLYRFAGGIDSDRIVFTTVGKWKDTLQSNQWSNLEVSMANGNLAPLFDGNMGSHEQLDWEGVRDCFQERSDLYGLSCDGWGITLFLTDSSVLIVSDTTLNVITLASLVAREIPRHLELRLASHIGREVSLTPIYGARKLSYPWFADRLLVEIGEETHRTSIVGYVGRNGISYRLAPSLSELIDTLSENPNASISNIPYDRFGPAITPWLDADSMSRMYESYDIGPDNDTMYRGESIK